MAFINYLTQIHLDFGAVQMFAVFSLSFGGGAEAEAPVSGRGH